MTCQVCSGPLSEPLLDLGYQPLCNELIRSPGEPQTLYPLAVHYCKPCDLVQLGYVLPTERVFGDQYGYLTGTTAPAVAYFEALAARLIVRFELRPDDFVVDVGSGDGTFLRPFMKHGCVVFGVEGAVEAVTKAQRAGIPSHLGFLGRSGRVTGRTPNLLTAMNVLAHTDHVNEFCAELRAMMDDDTVLVVQNHSLLSLFAGGQFDTIYHEHLRYFTVASVARLLARHGMYVFDGEFVDYYGGSYIVYARTKENPQTRRFEAVQTLSPRLQFDLLHQKMLINRRELLNVLLDARATGGRVLGIGAPMKATTLLNYYGIRGDLVECIAETNPLKIGAAIPGVGIPIVDEKSVDLDRYDYALILTWNWAEALMAKYREMGFKGSFILPNPTVRVVG